MGEVFVRLHCIEELIVVVEIPLQVQSFLYILIFRYNIWRISSVFFTAKNCVATKDGLKGRKIKGSGGQEDDKDCKSTDDRFEL